MTPTDTLEPRFSNLIYAYTRADAIDDGTLIDDYAPVITILMPHKD